MLKIQNDKGETLFEVKDDATRPKAVELIDMDKPCKKCKQEGMSKTGEYPCPECGRNLLHDDNLDEPTGEE